MNADQRIEKIKHWILDYCESMPTRPKCLVIGVSGGIDSAVTSTICALTGMKTFVISMPIKQVKIQDDLSKTHCNWLEEKFKNIEVKNISLDSVFDQFQNALSNYNSEHAYANSKARIRMTTLYQVAGSSNGIVVGTGNKVEDFGVGFYTKYGDGGVDISPIADCIKTQIWEMGKELKILDDIIKSEPTDGLLVDGRTDASQLGMTYQELEEAIKNQKDKNHKKYLEIRKRNLHKMLPIPVCKMDN